MWNKEKKSNQELGGPSSTSFFAPGFRMIGDIDSNNDLRVEGIIQGNITTSKKIIVGSTGQIIGNVKASHLCIMGEIVGDILVTDTTRICETGIVNGTITSGQLQVDPGAELEATVKKLKSTSKNDAVKLYEGKNEEKKESGSEQKLRVVQA
ncbi:bactofilin family protein [Negadavirga shengliensis]|uniref:Polymer-forming cytoskeletal protein n=1 Tax=Negadavirga shengliensis TaxID=1389218 RepID=A0ABV9T1Z8_9BACT